MKITVVGAALIIAAMIVVVLVARALNSNNLGPEQKRSASQGKDAGHVYPKMPEKGNSNES
jgi:hypothetical protein